jgi:Zn finger protein HypA/HybF involved in hydrogenase expression
MLAEFKCMKCKFKWSSNPGPTQCPMCNHLYVEWLNYEEMRKMWDEIEKNKNKE